MNAPIDLKFAVRELDSLPTMPLIAQKLLTLDLNSDEGERLLLLLVAQDPLLSAKIIGLANSPLLGSSHKVSSVQEAALALGLSKVKSVATSIAIMSLSSQPIGHFDPQELWLHNMSVAFAMLPIVRAMPAKLRPSDDLVFLAGMLHDIGYLALAHLDTQRSDDLHMRLIIEKNRSSIDIEYELLNISHAELGAELAAHWDLPSEVVAIIRYHHHPDSPVAAAGLPLARIIHLTERLLPTGGLHECSTGRIAPEEWIALGIDPEQADEIAAQAAEQAEQAAQFVAAF